MNEYELISYFKSNYLNQLFEYISCAKTKRDTYLILRELSLTQSSLQTYYVHSRKPYYSLKSDISNSLNVITIEKFCKKININDPIINEHLPHLLIEYEEDKRQAYNEAMARYRKRS